MGVMEDGEGGESKGAGGAGDDGRAGSGWGPTATDEGMGGAGGANTNGEADACHSSSEGGEGSTEDCMPDSPVLWNGKTDSRKTALSETISLWVDRFQENSCDIVRTAEAVVHVLSTDGHICEVPGLW